MTDNVVTFEPKPETSPTISLYADEHLILYQEGTKVILPDYDGSEDTLIPVLEQILGALREVSQAHQTTCPEALWAPPVANDN